MTISFKIDKKDFEVVSKILDRADRIYQEAQGQKLDRMETMMDLSACHANGCALDFQKLLDAPDLDFAHDVFGIKRHINRQTGKLENCFVPRCHQREVT